MQQIVFDQPYRFIPTRVSRLWRTLIRLWLPGALRRQFGLVDIKTVGAERLRASLDAGHGVLVASNHSRASDPIVLGLALDRETGGKPSYVMAGWHLFMQSRWQRFILPRVGGFSIYREGTDRESLKFATNVLARGDGPLVVFPEGYVSHNIDRLAPLVDGTAFMARMAAKRRRKEGIRAGVVVLPTFVRYFFDGDIDEAVGPVLGEIEERLSWQTQGHLPLLERVERLAEALLSQREIEHLGAAGSGDTGVRVANLVEHILDSLERDWDLNHGLRDPMDRVRRLRGTILAGMTDGSDLTENERQRRWHQLGILYQVQQLTCHPPDGYLDGDPGAERILDVVDRFEEDLTDVMRPHPPRRAVIFFGEPIEADPARQRGGDGEPLTPLLRERLEGLLQESLDWQNRGGPA